jgi:hypothetical protein
MVDKVVSKSELRKMSVTLQVRATPEEKAMLKARAGAFGISVGELIRQTIFKSKPKSKTDLEAIHALAVTRSDLGRLGGMLKGALSGVFPNSGLLDQKQTRDLLHKIEAAQAEVVDSVNFLVGKA